MSEVISLAVIDRAGRSIRLEAGKLIDVSGRDYYKAIFVELKSTQSRLGLIGDELRANVESSAGAVDQIGERVERMRVQARADCVSESSVAVEEIAKTIESLDALIMSRTAAIAGVTDRTGELLSSMDDAVGRFRT